ncbi:hypothetical protein BN14_11218 [Rhizoctonia solani AG-1 IB]|uniref:Uncharacterized protein n=1 Tax=Thanatephorus cucumeris (strain AG1-IB / isolate 7/3/14) TaxID=1108050 RepID=M5CH13_THACB|nr:hypothetical protein BN14_11218 [Rhizoctonia solani AG-1 IB]
MWGLNLWALGTDVTPCILIDKEMEDFFNEIEHPRVITHCELDRLVRDMQALIRNRTIHWIKNPWSDLCDYLTQRVSVDLHEDIGGSKQTIRVAFLEQPKFEAISISDFQQHILRRISIQAQRVGRVWLGSAAGVQAELEEVLSRVTGGGIKHLTDPLENSLEQDNDSLLSQTSAGLDPDVPPPLQNLHLSQATGGTAMDSSYFSTNTTDSGPPHNSNGGFTPRGSAESMGAVQRELKLVDTTLVSDRPKGDMMCFRDGRLVARSPKREHDISNSASPLNSQSPTLTALNGIGSGLPSIPSVEDIPALRHTSEYESSVDLATPYRSDDTESAKHILVDDEEEDGKDEALVIAGTKRMSVATETEAGPSSQLKTI